MKPNFLLKVLRNAAIMGGTFFFTNFLAYDDYSLDEFKPLIIFVGTYIFLELGHHYHTTTSSNPRAKQINTFLF